MDVFNLHRHLLDDYTAYTKSFIRIADDRIRTSVEDEIAAGLLWPEPLLQLNPSFEPGATIDELVAEGVLHEECSRIFRIKENDNDFGKPLRLFCHQEQYNTRSDIDRQEWKRDGNSRVPRMSSGCVEGWRDACLMCNLDEQSDVDADIVEATSRAADVDAVIGRNKGAFCNWGTALENDPSGTAAIHRDLDNFALFKFPTKEFPTWSDRSILESAQKGFSHGAWKYGLSPDGTQLKIEAPENSATVPMEVRVGCSCDPEDALTYVTIQATKSASLLKETFPDRRRHPIEKKAKVIGSQVAVRGTVVPQYDILPGGRISERTRATSMPMVWACWPNASGNTALPYSGQFKSDISIYENRVTLSLEAIEKTLDSGEILSIISPNAFLPFGHRSTYGKPSPDGRPVREPGEETVFRAYRTAWLRAVSSFSQRYNRECLIHNVKQEDYDGYNEQPGIPDPARSQLCYLAPPQSDADANVEILRAAGLNVVASTTGDQTGHIGNGAKNPGGARNAKDERDARLAPGYLVVFSPGVNPNIVTGFEELCPGTRRGTDPRRNRHRICSRASCNWSSNPTSFKPFENGLFLSTGGSHATPVRAERDANSP